jgi:hypothetical protein
MLQGITRVWCKCCELSPVAIGIRVHIEPIISNSHKRLWTYQLQWSATEHSSTCHCIRFYTICWMYWYRLQIKWDYKKKDYMLKDFHRKYIAFYSATATSPFMLHNADILVWCLVQVLWAQPSRYREQSAYRTHHSKSHKRLWTNQLHRRATEHSPTCHCIRFYTICWMYWYTLQIKWGFKKI